MTPDYHTITFQSDNAIGHCECGVSVVLPGRYEKAHVCLDCHRPRTEGDWPICPHGKANFGEEPLEPYFDEHISESGEWITTRGQRRAIMAKNHFEYRKRRYDLRSGKTYIDMSRGR